MGVLLVSLIFCLVPILTAHGRTSPVKPTNSTLLQNRRCEGIQIDLCKSLPYNRTRLPNKYEQENQADVNNSLWDLAHRFNAVVCSKDLVFFFCTLYLPICVENQEIKEIILPCRSVCEKVKEDCRAFLQRVNGMKAPFVISPDEFDCHKLKDYNKGVCLTPEAFIESRSTTRPSQASHTRRQLKKRDFLEANFDFGLKGKILWMKRNPNGYILGFNVTRVFLKCSACNFREGKTQIWSRSTHPCYKRSECTHLSKGNKYVIFGHKNGTNELTLRWACPFPKERHFLSELRLWIDELRNNTSSKVILTPED